MYELDNINNANLFMENIEQSRIAASQEVAIHKQKLFEQYFTPLDIAKYMSSLFSDIDNVKLLDAGAGVGNLGLISALKFLNKSSTVNLISVEWDKKLINFLKGNLSSVRNKFSTFNYKIVNNNFYNFALHENKKSTKYNRIILNPPYSKTSTSNTIELKLLQDLNIKTPNSYTNFIEICINMLDEDGELVAIVPRSFCNGTRFTQFRNNLINKVNIEFIHLFESRKKVFKEYGVLQEILIIKLTKRNIKKVAICISDKLTNKKIEKFPKNKIIFNSDPYKFIHIPNKEIDENILNEIYKLPSSLKELGLNISTGKVVEYREPDLIKDNKNDPLAAFVIYQTFLKHNVLNLNIKHERLSFLAYKERSKHKMIESGNYIIMKRISYKESKKRIVTALISDTDFKHRHMTIENHLNYIHNDGKGIDTHLAIGLNAFLNTNVLDNFIRRFSGHTQINASDILSLPMPNSKTLVNLGKTIYNGNISEKEIENLIFKENLW